MLPALALALIMSAVVADSDGSFAFPDVVVVPTETGVRILDAKTRALKGEALGAFSGERSDDGALVLHGDATLYVDTSGKTLRTLAGVCGPFVDERAACDERGYVDAKGAVVIAFANGESGDPFSSGVAVVRGRKGERVVDKAGKTLLRVPLPFRIFGAFVDASSGLGAAGARGLGAGGAHARLVGDLRSGSALVALDGTITEVPEVWTAKPAWPAAFKVAPTTSARPRDMAYQALEQTTLRSGDAVICAQAAESMVAISKGADAAAWDATERCAKLGPDDAHAADAHAAALYVAALDPGVRRTRDAWATVLSELGGKIPTK